MTMTPRFDYTFDSISFLRPLHIRLSNDELKNSLPMSSFFLVNTELCDGIKCSLQ